MKRSTHSGTWPDLLAATFGVLLVAAAIVVGQQLLDAHEEALQVSWPPLSAIWHPHLGPGTPAVVVIGILVAVYGPAIAMRLRLRWLMLGSWLASMAWIWSLALVDGWYRGIAEQLTTKNEYLQVIDRFDNIPAALTDFTKHILLHSPDNWPAHIAGHPPAATLTFVLLDRIGLGGGAWAGIWCITIGSTAVMAVLLSVKMLANEAFARRAAPFVVLAPSAVWLGTSADGYFAAVAAWTVALAAVAAKARSWAPTSAAALGSGLLFGLTVYLSYGLTLIIVIVAAVFVITRSVRAIPIWLVGAAVIPLAFTIAGFNWWQGYQTLVERYYQGAGGERVFAYWIWANLACTVILIGLAAVAGLRRTLTNSVSAGRRLLTARPTARDRLTALVMAALLAVLMADLSGMSKAETERIWLPFASFLLVATAMLPAKRRQYWLLAQALLPFAVNHLLTTSW